MLRICVVSVLCALALAEPLTGQSDEHRNQLTLEVSPTFAGAATYAWRLPNPDYLLGIGVGLAWELNQHSFDREVWNVLHVEGFVRYQPVPWFQGDLGLSAARTSPGDDTAEQVGFFGVYGAAMVGVGVFFVGPQVRLGRLGSELGWIGTVAIRFVVAAGGSGAPSA